jgi:hypothetical protein
MIKRLPRRLFKLYSPSERTIQTLTEGNIYFASPHQLNDPFDCQISVDTQYPEEKIYDLALAILKIWSNISYRFQKEYSPLYFSVDEDKPIQRRFDFLVEDFLSRIMDYGIFSMTEEINNPLLWSHYTSNYSGFAIELNPKFPLVKSMYNNLHKVEYRKSIPHFAIDNLIEMTLDDIEKTTATVKGTYWRYEKEWRLISERGGMIYKFPFKIEAIYFGFLSTEVMRKRIIDLFGKEIRYHIAIPNEKSFDLSFHNYEERRYWGPGFAKPHRNRSKYIFDNPK